MKEQRRNAALVREDDAWRAKVKGEHPIVGRLASALTARPVLAPVSQSTTAWKTGAVGEEQVARWLADVPGIISLHDRRVPGSKANIDHIVVSSGGVYVIDAKRYTGRVERRDVGSLPG